MPEVLKRFLQGQTSTVAREHVDELWNWLDGNPNAILEMIETLCDAFPPVRKPLQREDFYRNQ